MPTPEHNTISAPEFDPALPIRPVANDVLLLRLPLPFRLDHVNSYLLRDGDGWAIVDAGVADAATIGLWEATLPALGRVTRIIVTHHHPDHIGAARFLTEATGAPMLIGRRELRIAQEALDLVPRTEAGFEPGDYFRHGLSEQQIAALKRRSGNYRRSVPGLPDNVVFLEPGESLTIGARRFELMMLGGHSPAQLLMHALDDRLLIAADHVLGTISPNIGALSPDENPLATYLGSFPPLAEAVAPETLVLAGHGRPFAGLGRRLDELSAHHRQRAELLVEICRAEPGQSTAAIVPKLFTFALDEHQYWFAFREALAHLNYLLARGQLRKTQQAGVEGWHPAAA